MHRETIRHFQIIFEPIKIIYVLLLLRKLLENQVLTLDRQLESQTEVGLCIISVSVKMNAIFSENASKWK